MDYNMTYFNKHFMKQNWFSNFEMSWGKLVNGTTYFYEDLPFQSKLKNNLKGESQEKHEGPKDKRSNGLKSISQRDKPLDGV